MKYGNTMRNLLFVLCMLLSVSAFAQQRVLTGRVTDKQGEPIPGVSIIIKGTSTGTATDFEGNYNLKVQTGNILEFSFIGYKTQTITIAGQTTLNIVLQEDVEQLDEVVVIGYGTVKKNDATGSVVAIKADELNRAAVTSPQQMLQGKVTGVQIIPGDGGPGSGATIRIRGAASLTASNDPLIVIDGVPVSNDAAPGMANALSTINPNDIESFTVLKDASATAIYGSRASNGVIIITTKKGKGNKINLSYNGSFSIVTNSETVPVMGADEFREFITGIYPAGTTNGDKITNLLGTAKTDWQDLIFRNAFAHDHNISAYGNVNNILPYRASIGYTNEEGTLETSKYERGTFDVSVSPKLLDEHLTLNLNAKGVVIKNRFADGGAVNAAAFFNPTQPAYFYNEDGSINKNLTNGYWNWMNSIDPVISPNALATVSPLSQLYDYSNTNTVHRFIGNAQLDYKVHGFEALRANLNIGMDITSTDGKKGARPGSMQAWKDSENLGIGQYSKYTNFRRNQLLEFYLNFNKEFGVHRVDLMAGYSWQHFYSSDHSVSYFNETHEQKGDDYNYPFNRTEHYLISFFGRLNYSLMGKYLFTFTLRDDASSRFSEDNRWGLFPSAAIAWNLSEENFIKNIDPISSAKLRVGWGKTGQQEINSGDYPYLARYSLSTDQYHMYNMGNAGYIYKLTPQAYDPNIKWETTETWNAGLDLGFFNNRITASVDLYKRKTSDLLNTVTVPMGSNFSNTVLTNVGNMENKGVEIALNFIPVQTKDWNLSVGLNGTFQKIEFTKLTGSNDPNYYVGIGSISKGTGGYLQRHMVGSAPYTFYLYQQAYDSRGHAIQNALVDRDGDGVITSADRYMTNKSPNPDFFYGINLKLSYKNWDFGFNGHGSVGNWMFNDFYSSNSTANIDFASNTLSNYATTVKKTGFTQANVTEQWYSDMFLENASFFRLDDVNLGYTFRNIAKREGFNIRVAASVQNVFVITDYSGMDPEGTGVGGIDNNIWPRPRTYSLRLNVNF